jgi:alpha-beta hydrolase superfamily lysophospholipase
MTGFFQRRWKTLGGVAICIFVCGLIVSWRIGGHLCAPCNHPVAPPKDLPVEQVVFQSESGAAIHGWLDASETNRAIVILLHGIHSDKSQLVGRARFLTRSGYGVLLFDFQAHGESVAPQITFGYLESRDVQAAVEFVKKRFPGKPVGVVGVSLGAAAAAMANPPLEVQALVLEMMYPTIVDATKDRIEMQLGRAGRLLSPLLTAQLRFRIGCTPDDLRPLVSVEKITAPKLFLAGTEDRDTTFRESKEIYAHAAEPKTFVPFEDARHQDLLKFAPEQYKKAVLDFLDKYLK